MKGRTIRIYLTDGTPDGIMTAEVINWTGKVIVFQRSQLHQLAVRPEARRTGVYILAGDDPDNPFQERVYIGESDNVLARLAHHDSDEGKDFWTRTLLVISKDDNLTKSHARYLETRLIKLAQQAKRATLSNGTAPDLPSLPEPDIADMEYFLAQAMLLLPVVGFSLAQPLPAVPELVKVGQNGVPEPAVIFEFALAGLMATAQEIGGEFVVLKDSLARKTPQPSMSDRACKLQEQFRADGRLVEAALEDRLRFTADVAFASPSGAAQLVAATAINGRTYWRVKGTGQTYGAWKQAQLATAVKLAQIDDIADANDVGSES